MVLAVLKKSLTMVYQNSFTSWTRFANSSNCLVCLVKSNMVFSLVNCCNAAWKNSTTKYIPGGMAPNKKGMGGVFYSYINYVLPGNWYPPIRKNILKMKYWLCISLCIWGVGTIDTLSWGCHYRRVNLWVKFFLGNSDS